MIADNYNQKMLEEFWGVKFEDTSKDCDDCKARIRADAIEECLKAICDYMYSNNIHLIKIAKDEADTPIYPYKVADEICEQLKEKRHE